MTGLIRTAKVQERGEPRKGSEGLGFKFRARSGAALWGVVF